MNPPIRLLENVNVSFKDHSAIVKRYVLEGRIKIMRARNYVGPGLSAVYFKNGHVAACYEVARSKIEIECAHLIFSLICV